MIYKGANVLNEHKKKKLMYDGTLEQITFLDRRVYKKEEGVYYPSVTTVLQYMPKNKFFDNWLKDVGHNADLIMRKAANEGTAVHEAVEDLIAGKEITWMDDFGNAKYNLVVWNMILKAAEFFKKHKPTIIAAEEFTFSDEFKYAGTADLIVEMDGERWLLDVKTSNNLHRSYNLQLAAYAKAWEEMFGQKIDRTGILWLKSSKRGASKKEGVYQGKGWEVKQIDGIDENFELFKTIYSLFKLDNPVTEPIYNSYPTKVRL
tara:strand:- start:2848 stop:3630 length:783 start_codon:yes stop_codon:yes gene_type:complete